MRKNTRYLASLITILLVGVVVYRMNRPGAGTLPESRTETQALPEKKAEEKSTEVKVEEKQNISFAETLKALPTIKDLHLLSEEEVHFTPKVIKDAGFLIGKLIQEAQDKPHLREETLKFLKASAENPDLAPAIRALCWNRTLSHIVKWEIFLPVADAEVPEEIKNLAARIP